MIRRAIPLVALFLAACSGAQVKDTSSAAIRAALVEGYEARLVSVIDASTTCPQAVANIRAEEAKWSAVWEKAGVTPEAPMVLRCPAPPVAPGGGL